MNAADVVPLQSWKGRLKQGDRGPTKCITNLMLHLRHLPELGERIRLNELAGTAEWNGEPLVDQHYVDVRMLIEAAGYSPDKGDIPAGVDRLALDHRYHPVRDYLSSLHWDRQPRIDRWLRVYLGAPDHSLSTAFGSKFLIGAVARAMRPGCKMDNVLVLEGRQGIGKTRAVATLFGPDFMTSNLGDLRGREGPISIQGFWVVEIGELASLRGAAVEDAKKFFSETVDRYRPMHARNIISRPRQCVFVGTTNADQYLSDATGNRRYWPVPVSEIDLVGLSRDRDQLWAEAVHRQAAGEHWWIDDEALLNQAAAAQADRVEEDIWAATLDPYLTDPEVVIRGYVTTAELLGKLGMMPDKQTRAAQMRAADHLSRRGWTRAKRRVAGRPAWTWSKPA
jgi:predicted P-loop ATPase